MSSARSSLFRGAFLLVTAAILAGCAGSSASVAPPSAAAATSAPESVAPAASASVAVTASAAAPSVPGAAASATSAANGGSGDCATGMIGRQKFTMFGMEADKYCGPATATVTLAGTTISLTNGWCETNAAGFTLSLGTQLFGNPTQAQEPDFLVALVNPTTGAGPISGVASHHNWLLNDQSIHFGADHKSGTFAGTAIVGGAVSGSFACGG